MKSKSRSLGGVRLGLFGKGGSGKSTTTVLLAQALHNRRYDVCVLDADSTNVGLHQALGIAKPPASLLDLYGGMVFSGGSVTCPVDDPTVLEHADLSLKELPSEYYAENADGVRLMVAGKIGSLGPGAGCDGPISKIARDFQVATEDGSGLMIVDFKAGFEDSARGALTNLDCVVQIVDPTQASIEMAICMDDMVRQVRAGIPPATDHLEDPSLVSLAKRLFKDARVKGTFFILNRVDNPYTEDLLRAELGKRGIRPIGVIRDDPSILVSWLEGRQLTGPRVQADAARIVMALEKAFSGRTEWSVGASVA